MKEQFSLLIYELRQQLGVSQEKLAAQLGVSFQTVNRWENRRVQPSAIAVQLVKQHLTQMGSQGEDLLGKYFLEDQPRLKS